MIAHVSCFKYHASNTELSGYNGFASKNENTFSLLWHISFKSKWVDLPVQIIPDCQHYTPDDKKYKSTNIEGIRGRFAGKMILLLWRK
jgi:hypothetical protein